MRGGDGSNEALPQMSNVGSDKRRSGEGGVAMMVRRQKTVVAEDKGNGG